jgi:hypothetical protein
LAIPLILQRPKMDSQEWLSYARMCLPLEQASDRMMCLSLTCGRLRAPESLLRVWLTH